MNRTVVTTSDVSSAMAKIRGMPDKSEHKSTTSRIFKLNLLQEFTGKPKFRWLEMGSARGHTTEVLAHLAEEVLAIDNKFENIKAVKELGYKNVITRVTDLYSIGFAEFIKNEAYDASFIDGIHKENNVLRDIKNCLSAGAKIFVFDDYGAYPGVKLAVDSFIKKAEEESLLKSRRFVGLPPGETLQNTTFKTLTDWEGVIVEINSDKDLKWE